MNINSHIFKVNSQPNTTLSSKIEDNGSLPNFKSEEDQEMKLLKCDREIDAKAALKIVWVT